MVHVFEGWRLVHLHLLEGRCLDVGASFLRTPSNPHHASIPIPMQPKLHSVDSYAEMHRSTHPHDIYVRIEEGGAGKRPGFKAPLTRVVATPCYRCG